MRPTKAARLKRIKSGYFNPPTGRPIFVPGFNWLQLLITGLKGDPVLAHLWWWTTGGEKASQKREEEGKFLKKVAKLCARKVIHVWDRGFAGNPWTTIALDHHLRFILRWNKNYHLIGPDGCKHEVWKISRGMRSWEYRMLWEARRRCDRKPCVIALPIHLPEDDRQLLLVVSRPGYGRKPWYLITTEPVFNAEQARQIIFAHARRWQIEMSLRFTKSEMAFKSPRLLKWESRLKILLIASLAYAFLLSLLPHPPDFQILSQNWKVEPINLSSTLSLTSGSFTSLARFSPSLPSYINFGVSHVCSFCFGLTLFDNLPANLVDRFIRQQFLAIAHVIAMIGFEKKTEQNSLPERQWTHLSSDSASLRECYARADGARERDVTSA